MFQQKQNAYFSAFGVQFRILSSFSLSASIAVRTPDLFNDTYHLQVIILI